MNFSEYLKIYKLYIKNDIQSQLSYRLSFIGQIIVWFFYTFIPFLSFSFLFNKFGGFPLWDIYHIGVFYGIVGTAYDLSRMIGRTFDNFHTLCLSGNLDIYYIRPAPLVLQIFGSGFFLRRLGGILQYLCVLIYSLYHVIFLDNWMLIIPQVLFSLLSSTLIFSGLLLIYASLCFVTIDRNSFTDVFVDSSARIGFYPREYLIKPIKMMFTYFIPLSVVVYLPMKKVFEGSSFYQQLIFYIYTLFIGAFFFWVSYRLFEFTRKKYQSVNC